MKRRRSPSRYRPSISDVIVHWNWHVSVIICVCIVAQPSLLAQTEGVDAMMIQGKVSLVPRPFQVGGVRKGRGRKGLVKL